MFFALALRLEGPFQSWGAGRQGDTTPSEPVPTLSGVVGLLGAASGVVYGDVAGLRALQDRFRLVVRVDRPGTSIFDFQTVHGVPPRNGARVKDTLVSSREYLCDASFLALCVAPTADALAPLRAALLAPRWPLSLGRFACVPSRPVLAHPEVRGAATLPELVRLFPRAARATSREIVFDEALPFPGPVVRRRTVRDRFGRSGLEERRVAHVLDAPHVEDTVDAWFEVVSDAGPRGDAAWFDAQDDAQGVVS